MNFDKKMNLVLLVLMASCTKVVISCVARSNKMRRTSPRSAFYLYQKVPDIDETSQGASGKFNKVIERNSKEFRSLTQLFNPGIIFESRDRGIDDARYMTERCMKKLNNLEKLVKQRWPKIKLKVMAAWDDAAANMHSEHSLHYEGRAVDITTSDSDRTKLGLLARLAVEAGFDWVFYIHKQRVHASVRAEGTKRPSPGCFKSNSTVRLESGQIKKLSHVGIGDKVQSVNSNGEIIYSDVIMFIDNKPNEKDVMYFVLETSKPATKLYLTMNHLVYVKRRFSSLWTTLLAKNVQKGDSVNVSTSDGKMVTAEVTSIRVSMERGAIAPLTNEGNIVVDGVLASCYASLENRDFVDSIFQPAKWLYKISPSLLNSNLKAQKGIHWYAKFLLYLNDYFSVLT